MPTIAAMADKPQPRRDNAVPPILDLAAWIADPVEPADFPRTQLRWRNDRAADEIGLDSLSDEEWIAHLGLFEPLPGNLPQPLALRYHGHQFRVYNPEIGDGRGFLFAQLRDEDGRLMDLGTKGSGQTPWSRAGDGRLTLKGAVRELLATEMLEALGVNTSRTFSIVETGEELWRGDEPSPTRSAVLTRLSHGHIRIGTFQRLLAHDEPDHMRELVDYCLTQFPGPPPPDGAPNAEDPAVRLLHQVVERLADTGASWMVAGFVHGVLNTDNMNVSGESFDYGPWRWLPKWEPGFTAAYFDHAGLYAFGRQPEALGWNCAQLATALRLVAPSEGLIAALERFGPLYGEHLRRRWLWRLGVKPRGEQEDAALIAACERHMRDSGSQPDAFFFAHRTAAPDTEPARLIGAYERTGNDHDYWREGTPESMLIDEVEAIWSAIDERDDWQPLMDKVNALRRMGEAHGEPPPPAAQALENASPRSDSDEPAQSR